MSDCELRGMPSGLAPTAARSGVHARSGLRLSSQGSSRAGGEVPTSGRPPPYMQHPCPAGSRTLPVGVGRPGVKLAAAGLLRD